MLTIEAPSNIPAEDGYTILRWGAFVYKWSAAREPLAYAFDVVVDERPRCSLIVKGAPCEKRAIMELRVPCDEGLDVFRSCNVSTHLAKLGDRMRNLGENDDDVTLNFRSYEYFEGEITRKRYVEIGVSELV